MRLVSRTLASLAAVAAVALGTLTAVVAPATEAEAADTTSFDAGMIITDELFYDSNAMTASEIQTFLNKKVPTCLDDNLTNDITCLKDYKTTTVAKSTYVSSYTGAVLCSEISKKSATAAQVIDIVARACGVSQKVLLVLLQKEQGLVTATDPGVAKYNKATGYACPDSGSCDAQYYGLFNQLYNAALQYKRYQDTPARYGYVAGMTNTIKWHPNSSCGTTKVYIENQATAGLYNYTPYVPNSAALSAGYGTGNSCSSYGNRNFFNYYEDWFGSTQGVPVDARLQAAYDNLGGEEVLGSALAESVLSSANGGGRYQRMSNGWLYQTRDGAQVFLAKTAAITKAFIAAGGPTGSWGWPITNQAKVDGYTTVEFQNLRVAVVDGKVVAGYPFTDVSANRRSNDYTALAEGVFWMADSGISEGWTTSSGVEFRPRQTVNRDVMAAFLYRFVGESFTFSGSSSFIDVPSSNAFVLEIEWLGRTGISNGWTTSEGAQFRPLNAITREQMAAFLYRLADPSDYTAPAKSPFTDVKTTDTFYTEIAWLAEQGISTGWSTSSGAEFRPLAKITREQMAAFLYRMDGLDF